MFVYLLPWQSDIIESQDDDFIFLRRLARNYLPKKKDEDDYQWVPLSCFIILKTEQQLEKQIQQLNDYFRFTATKAFKLMLNEINDLAGQHEVIAENQSTAVVSDLTTLVKSMKDDRRKVRIWKFHC